MMVLFLGLGLAAMFGVRFLQKKRAPGAAPKQVRKMLPEAVSVLIITAQVSELVNVVEHVTVVHMAAALMLLAIIVATKTGTEIESR